MTAKKAMVLSVLAALFVAGSAIAAPAVPQCGDDHGDKTKDGKETKDGKKDGEKKPTS
jgi:hypothetical protein